MSREFSIDMIPGGTQTAVHCNQFEAGDTWDFALYYNGGRYTIPEDADVSITGTKADGAAYKVDGTVVNNAVRIEVTEQMTAAAGKTVAEILVVSDTDGTTLYSANFPIIVEPAAVQADLSPSEIPTAIAGPDGTIYYSEEAIISDGVTSEVRQALYTLLNSAAYAQTGLTDEIAVIQSWAQQITAISVSPTTASITGTGTSQLSATTTPAGGTVTWSSSDTSVATVSSSGLVTGVGNGTCTITASAGGKSATCVVTVTGNATLESISAVYTQSGTVYDTDSLDSLRSDLVVTGTYDDTSTATITGYTLSGTLTAGTSTVTVSYGGKTDTFTVTVTEAPLYMLTNGTHTYTATDGDGYITISDHDHVKMDRVSQASSGTGRGYNFICLSDLDYNGTDIKSNTNINNHSSIFSLSENDVVRFVISNVSGSFDDYTVGLREASGTTSVAAVSSQTTDADTTVTVNATKNVGCLFLYVGTQSAADKDFEADIAVYVNDVRYF